MLEGSHRPADVQYLLVRSAAEELKCGSHGSHYWMLLCLMCEMHAQIETMRRFVIGLRNCSSPLWKVKRHSVLSEGKKPKIEQKHVYMWRRMEKDH